MAQQKTFCQHLLLNWENWGYFPHHLIHSRCFNALTSRRWCLKFATKLNIIKSFLLSQLSYKHDSLNLIFWHIFMYFAKKLLETVVNDHIWVANFWHHPLLQPDCMYLLCIIHYVLLFWHLAPREKIYEGLSHKSLHYCTVVVYNLAWPHFWSMVLHRQPEYR